MEKEVIEFILEFIKPALQSLLDNINGEEYHILYLVGISIIFVIVLIISATYFVTRQITIKTEQKKTNEDRKEKQIKNYTKLSEYKSKYDTNFKLVQIAVEELTQLMQNNQEISNKKIEEYQALIFNELLESFISFQDVYEIVYENDKRRFKSFYQYEYLTFFYGITAVMEILNDKDILNKIGMQQYKINDYSVNQIYENMKNHFRFYHIIINCQIKKLRNDFLALSG